MMTPWKCKGTIKKYVRPCPQNLMFFNEQALIAEGITLEQLYRVISIKCPRCGRISTDLG